MSNFKKPDDNMKELIMKYNLNTKEKIIKFIVNELNRYQVNTYPLNCLVVLDDFANNELLTNRKSKLIPYFTKTRHYNITFIIAVQTIKFIPKNIKRMITDCVIYGGLSEDDFLSLMKELAHPWNNERLFEEYKNKMKTGDHIKLIMNLSAPDYSYED